LPLAATLTIAIAKGGTSAALTGLPALFAETVHTLAIADSGNEVLLYVAIRRTVTPRTVAPVSSYGPERSYCRLLAAIAACSSWRRGPRSWDASPRSSILPDCSRSFWAGVAVLLYRAPADGTISWSRGSLRVQAARRALPAPRLSCASRAIRRSSQVFSFEDPVDVLGAALAPGPIVRPPDRVKRTPRRALSIANRAPLCYLGRALNDAQPLAATKQSGSRPLRPAAGRRPDRGRASIHSVPRLRRSTSAPRGAGRRGLECPAG